MGMVRRIVPPDLQLILSGEPIVAVPLKDVASPLLRHPQMRVPFQVKDEPQRLPIEAEDWKSPSEVEKRPQALELGPEGPSQLQTSNSIRRPKSPG